MTPETTTPAQTTTLQAAVAQIPSRYELEDTKVLALVESYKDLAITDVDDTEAVAVVTEAWRDLRDKRLAVERTRKALKADIITYGKAVDARAKELTGWLKPEEDRLKGEVDRVKEEKARRKAEALAKRMEALAAVNSPLPADVVGAVSEEAFEKLLAEATEEHEKAEAERRAEEQRKAEEERKRREEEERRERRRIAQEEANRKERERLAAERAEIEAEKRRLADEARQVAAEKARLKAEAEAAEAAKAAQSAPEPVEEASTADEPEPTEPEPCTDPEPEVESAPEPERTSPPAAGSYVWSSMIDHFESDGFSTTEGALEDAAEAGYAGDTVYVGQVVRHDATEAVSAEQMADWLLGEISEWGFSEAGEAAEDYPDVSEDDEALRARCAAFLAAELERPEWTPEWYTVPGPVKMEIPADA